jgi:hypothetical protein
MPIVYPIIPPASGPSGVLEIVRDSRTFAGNAVNIPHPRKPRGDVLLDTIEAALRGRSAEVIRCGTPTFAMSAPMDLRHEIVEQALDLVLDPLL